MYVCWCKLQYSLSVCNPYAYVQHDILHTVVLHCVCVDCGGGWLYSTS